MCVDGGMRRCRSVHVTFGFVDTQNSLGIAVRGKDWGDVANRPRSYCISLR